MRGCHPADLWLAPLRREGVRGSGLDRQSHPADLWLSPLRRDRLPPVVSVTSSRRQRGKQMPARSRIRQRAHLASRCIASRSPRQQSAVGSCQRHRLNSIPERLPLEAVSESAPRGAANTLTCDAWRPAPWTIGPRRRNEQLDRALRLGRMGENPSIHIWMNAGSRSSTR
jgi:hypothetical protein